jgi:hypothetical protein
MRHHDVAAGIEASQGPAVAPNRRTFMKLATATLAAAAFLALAAPVRAGDPGSKPYQQPQQQNMEREKENRPYALTGDARRTNDGGFKAKTEWVGANRERRTVYERE